MVKIWGLGAVIAMEAGTFGLEAMHYNLVERAWGCRSCEGECICSSLEHGLVNLHRNLAEILDDGAHFG